VSKFHVNARVTSTRILSYEIKVTKAEVVEELGLEGEDRAAWRDHIEDFLNNDLEAYLDDAAVFAGDDPSEETIESIELDAVSEA
jgi:hypothetical protein